ncbi:Predicted phosphoribosyltransferase [Desulforamulus putei DSM 12395]|uniref:Predicted phosphoribosyltransferase n=1 Tax=Desulforamulus putei DSM 12395 TaxID=1121429 RepID=A0A1M5BNR6_9FIRM|nr:phosphoribosyltransferase [Desulforamulus putei]SHF44121.1 Predicted phosphoribosyltransferase [Desulforamulus putei DSM 12395]
MFKNRIDAGQRLAESLKKINIQEGIVIAVPRGGVVVGAQVAQALDIPLDIIIPKKVGAPQNPEVAVGAVTEDGTVIYNQNLLNRLGLSEKDLAPAVQKIISEIKRRMTAYRGSSKSPDFSGKHVILVDDGIATGFTIMAALRSIKNAGCQAVTLAIPVAPPDTVERLEKEVDHLVCLVSEEPFYAVGQFYRDFSQISDDEVISILKGYQYCL